jgi:hypothetical protein
MSIDPFDDAHWKTVADSISFWNKHRGRAVDRLVHPVGLDVVFTP